MPFIKKDLIEVIQSSMPELELTYSESDKPFYIAKCPFHNDRNPSFVAFPLTQKWICYSCHPEQSDVIDFVQKQLGCNFVEARKIACQEVENESYMLYKLREKIQRPEAGNYTDRQRGQLMDRLRDLQVLHPKILENNVRRLDLLLKSEAYFSLDTFIRKLERNNGNSS